MLILGRCKACISKDNEIAYLRNLVSDLMNRLMSRDFSGYIALTTKENKPKEDKSIIFDENLGVL